MQTIIPQRAVAQQHTIAEALGGAARTLADRSESPRLDAELLLCKITGWSRSALIIRGTEPLAAAQRRHFEALIAQRASGVPVAYLTGTREFWSLGLGVTPAVLVPRPETELLVEQALALLPQDAAGPLLDLGTGSGAIALAIASERPHLRVTAVDISAAALAVASANGAALGLSHLDWRLGSWFDAVPGERFAVIVANPPYVAADDPALHRLAAEPLLALTPGPTGLEALTPIVAGAAAHLHPGGWLLLEHGNDQAIDVSRLLDAAGFSRVRTLEDHAGRPRVTLGAAPAGREPGQRARPGSVHASPHSSHQENP
jgi:release factor glutamine methyltransferase